MASSQRAGKRKNKRARIAVRIQWQANSEQICYFKLNVITGKLHVFKVNILVIRMGIFLVVVQGNDITTDLTQTCLVATDCRPTLTIWRMEDEDCKLQLFYYSLHPKFQTFGYLYLIFSVSKIIECVRTFSTTKIYHYRYHSKDKELIGQKLIDFQFYILRL